MKVRGERREYVTGHCIFHVRKSSYRHCKVIGIVGVQASYGYRHHTVIGIIRL